MLIFALAQRNGVTQPHASVAALRAAHAITDLQSFLDIYYADASVLLHEADFFDMAYTYSERAAADGVLHAELFFDPQTHTERGVDIGVVIEGLHRACRQAKAELGLDASLILCFLRHLSEDAALATLAAALPWRDQFIGVGLDSSERGTRRRSSRGYSPRRGHWDCTARRMRVRRARRPTSTARWRCCRSSPSTTACAASKARPWWRGWRARMPLTVCPLSNIGLCVFTTLAEHNLPALLDAGLCATVNSDDPAYFGGYVNDNFIATFEALPQLGVALAYQLLRNSFEASFASAADKAGWIARLDAAFAGAALR